MLRTVVPVLSTVGLGAAMVAIASGAAHIDVPALLRGATIPVWIAASIFFFKWFGSIPDVWLDGDELLVESGGRRVRVSLRDVTEIRQSHFQKTKTITLHLGRNTPLGAKVRFVPHFALMPGWVDHPVAKELRERREQLLAGGEDKDSLPG